MNVCPSRRLPARKCPLNSVWAAAAMLLSAGLGCGPEPYVDPNRATVSGAVTFDGKPLPAGVMSFDSAEGHIGTTISIQQGRYATDRVPLGANTVTIETESLKFGSPGLYTKIPVKYADSTQSGLTADIKPGANENVNFDLKK